MSTDAGGAGYQNATGHEGETVHDPLIENNGPTLFPKLSELVLTAIKQPADRALYLAFRNKDGGVSPLESR
jgi:hypothetical protein